MALLYNAHKTKMFWSIHHILHICKSTESSTNLEIFFYLIFHMLIQNISISYIKDVFIIILGSEVSLVSAFELIHNTDSESGFLVQSYLQVPHKPKMTFITQQNTAATSKIV